MKKKSSKSLHSLIDNLPPLPTDTDLDEATLELLFDDSKDRIVNDWWKPYVEFVKRAANQPHNPNECGGEICACGKVLAEKILRDNPIPIKGD